MRYPAKSVSDEVSVFSVGGDQSSVTDELAAAVGLTVMENAGRFVQVDPSLAPSRIFRYVPTWLGPGTPVILPVAVSIESQKGLLRMLNMIRPPSGSRAAG